MYDLITIFFNFFDIRLICEFLQMKSSSVVVPHIIDLVYTFEVSYQMKEFIVIFIIIERDDRDSVVNLERKWVDWVINQD